jgi:hypothetical protein
MRRAVVAGPATVLVRRQITMRLAPPRAARAPEYTAPMTRTSYRIAGGGRQDMISGHLCWRRVANL